MKKSSIRNFYGLCIIRDSFCKMYVEGSKSSLNIQWLSRFLIALLNCNSINLGSLIIVYQNLQVHLILMRDLASNLRKTSTKISNGRSSILSLMFLQCWSTIQKCHCVDCQSSNTYLAQILVQGVEIVLLNQTLKFSLCNFYILWKKKIKK